MRMSLRQFESSPARWPTAGMINALAAGVLGSVGVIGVTRLSDTGTVYGGGGVSFVAMCCATVTEPYTTRIVPIHVPFCSVEGSATIVRLRPAGVMMPDV